MEHSRWNVLTFCLVVSMYNLKSFAIPCEAFKIDLPQINIKKHLVEPMGDFKSVRFPGTLRSTSSARPFEF